MLADDEADAVLLVGERQGLVVDEVHAEGGLEDVLEGHVPSKVPDRGLLRDHGPDEPVFTDEFPVGPEVPREIHTATFCRRGGLDRTFAPAAKTRSVTSGIRRASPGFAPSLFKKSGGTIGARFPRAS